MWNQQNQSMDEIRKAIAGVGGRLWLCVVVLLCGGLLLAGGSAGYAQSSLATLGGQVVDQQERVVPGAEVVVTSMATGVDVKTHTNNAGQWRVDSLVAGSYRFSVTAAGFSTLEHSAVELQIADKKFVDVSLQVGAASEKVVVEAETPLIDTTAAVAGTVINNDTLQELPSATNGPTELVTLAPGFFISPPSGGAVSLWSNDSASGVKANGSGSGTNAVNYVLDGATNTIASSGKMAFIPPMDSLSEVRAMVNSYDASISRTAAGTVNVSMKSGGDKFHGVLYERNQNNFMNANTVQNKNLGKPTPTVRFNEYGGTLGGPVLIPKLYDGRKRGTFFFFSYDGVRNISPSGSGYMTLPSADERKGDFSNSWEIVNGTKYQIKIYDPLTVDKSTGNRQLMGGTGTAIPSARISSVAKAVFNALPLPNVTPGAQSSNYQNYAFVQPKNDKFNSYALRVDHAWNNNHHSYVNMRKNSLREQTNNPFAADSPLRGQELDRDNYGFTIDHAWVISPKLLLAVNANMTAYKYPQYSNSANVDAAKYGFSQKFVDSQLVKGLPKLAGPMNTTDTFWGTTLGNFVGPLYENDYNWEIHGSLTQTLGNHVLRYGAEYLLQQEAAGNQNGGATTLNFSNKWTIPNPNTSAPSGTETMTPGFILGLPEGGSMVNTASAFWSQPFMGFFAQDDWRVTSKLTLNLGARWDVQKAMTERSDRFFGRFDPDYDLTPVTAYAQPKYQALIGGTSPNTGVSLLQKYRSDATTFRARGAIQYAGVDGTSRAVSDLQYKYIQPRIGFAYQVNPTLVLRGGFGRFTQANFVANHGNQLGYSATTPYTATTDNYYTSSATLDNPFPNGLVQVTGNSLRALTSVGSVTSFWTANVKRQYTDDVSLRLQQQFKSYLFEMAGVFQRTMGLTSDRQIDAPSATAWHAAYDAQFDTAGRPVDTLPGDVQVANPFKGAPYITSSLVTSSTVNAYRLLRPNPLVDGMTETFYNGSSMHYGLQTRVDRRFKNGFGLSTNFTWGKQMDETEYYTPATVSQKLHRTLSANDIRFQYVLSPIYVLPFGRGQLIGAHVNRLTDRFISGWEVSGIYTFYSGTPIKLPTNSGFFQGGDPSLANKSKTKWFDTSKFKAFPGRSMKVADVAAYPDWTGVKNMPGSSWTPSSASDATQNGVYQDFKTWVSDNSPYHGTVRNPYMNNWNIGLRKNVPIREAIRLQLRFDAFNALNHPQFGSVNTDPNNAYFGYFSGSATPSAVNSPRSIQLEGKLYF